MVNVLVILLILGGLKMQKLCQSAGMRCFLQIFLIDVNDLDKMKMRCSFLGCFGSNYLLSMMLISHVWQLNERRYSFPLLAVRISGSWMLLAALSCFLQ